MPRHGSTTVRVLAVWVAALAVVAALALAIARTDATGGDGVAAATPATSRTQVAGDAADRPSVSTTSTTRPTTTTAPLSTTTDPVVPGPAVPVALSTTAAPSTRSAPAGDTAPGEPAPAAPAPAPAPPPPTTAAPATTAPPPPPPTTAPPTTAPPQTAPPPTAPPTTAPPTTAAPGAPRDTACEHDMLAWIGQTRADHGLGALAVDGAIRPVPQAWTQHLVESQVLAHNPDYARQIVEIRPEARVLGEIVGRGRDHRRIFEEFMASPPHHDLIHEPAFRHAATACLIDPGGQRWITVNFWG